MASQGIAYRFLGTFGIGLLLVGTVAFKGTLDGLEDWQKQAAGIILVQSDYISPFSPLSQTWALKTGFDAICET